MRRPHQATTRASKAQLLVCGWLCVGLGALGWSTPAAAQDPGATPQNSDLATTAPGSEASAEADDTPRATRTVHRRRAVVELGTSLALGAVWYYAIDLEGNAADWDFPSLEQRLTLASLRFDNNGFNINFLWHPLSGALYYALPRANGLGVWESFLYGFATTIGWEYGLEFREKSSINDLFSTPVAGVPIGEFYTQLGRYLGSAPRRGPVRAGLAWSLGVVQTAHDALDGYAPPPPRELDHLGYDAALWHAFSLSVHSGSGHAGRRGYPWVTGLQLEGEFADLPGYRRAGRSQRVVAGAPRSRLQLTVEGSSAGAATVLRTDTLLLAHYTRHITETADGLRGHAMTVGTGIGFDYHYLAALPGQRGQRIAITHLPGLVLEGDTFTPWSELRLRLSVQPDFVGLDAPGYAQWALNSPDVMTKSVLRKQGYYYGFGGSVQARARYRYRWLRAEAFVDLGAVRSTQGHDRIQSQLDVDLKLADELLGYALWLGLTPPDAPATWFFDLGLQGWHRSSRAGNVSTTRDAQRYLARAGLRF